MWRWRPCLPWVLYLGIGFLVHGVLLKDTYTAVRRRDAAGGSGERHPADCVRRARSSGSSPSRTRTRKGYEGGNGLQEGLRFGVLVGIMLCAFGSVWDYMMWPIGTRLLAAWLIDFVVEFAIYGMVVGLIYKPAVVAARRPAIV